MRLLRQKDKAVARRALESAQSALGVAFPPEFTRTICEFDLGKFELASAQFGASGDYASELVRLNGIDEYGGKWWSGERRPANLIVFAVGDPWIYLLDCGDGAVYAWLLEDEELWGRRVASDFERFFRALASIDIARLSGQATPGAEDILKFAVADGSQTRDNRAQNLQTQAVNAKNSRTFGRSAGKILGGKVLADGSQTQNRRPNATNGAWAGKFDRNKSSADARDRNSDGGSLANANSSNDKALEFWRELARI